MILGIDVGLTGAVAVLNDFGMAIEVFDLPVMANGKQGARVKQQVNAGELARMLKFREAGRLGESIAYVEEQRAMPDQGVASVFSLGFSFGTVCAVLASIGLPFVLVTSAQWKKHFALAGADKDAARTLAIREFAVLAASLARKKDHNRAEALLLAKYGWWRRGPAFPGHGIAMSLTENGQKALTERTVLL